MEEWRLIKINGSNLSLLQSFLNSAGNKTLSSFRYFNSRPLSIINNHLFTGIIVNGAQPICYGHLDVEREKVWLGIAVAGEYIGMGWGKKMIQILLEKANDLKVQKITLAVDKDNHSAQGLYEKFGFYKAHEDSSRIYYEYQQ